ncbi:hypothetical protein CGLO_14908 [Colletotrichum gloeosporioides Cg-14]|uniref:Uncharacterized protein n=1 Tax=Colletotrichum gloeosporioides (strain Cg-14) TaxID=1237896 RepID=T0K2Y8_COLGC|nr:hypothetical protein CGLO_14908 [Colletotrichum gloeosporioides Cg-14]
MRKYLLEKE